MAGLTVSTVVTLVTVVIVVTIVIAVKVGILLPGTAQGQLLL